MIGFSFFIFSDFIRATLNSNEIFYFLLFNGEHQNPPFPYFGFYFIGSALGHYFANLDYSIINKKENKTITLNQKLILIGLISLLIGVLLGYQYSTDPNASIYLYYFSKQNYFVLQRLPHFLIRGSTSWSFYSLGITFFVLAFILKLDRWRIMKPQKSNILSSSNSIERENNPKGLRLFGEYSFTIYLIHNLLFAVFMNSLSIPFFIPLYIITTIIIYYGMKIWVYSGNSKFTIEWTIKETTNYVLKKVKNHGDSIN